MEEQQSFEQNMERLETVIRKLESGSASLEEMLALYEEGMELHEACAAQLDAYEGTLKRISASKEG